MWAAAPCLACFFSVVTHHVPRLTDNLTCVAPYHGGKYCTRRRPRAIREQGCRPKPALQGYGLYLYLLVHAVSQVG